MIVHFGSDHAKPSSRTRIKVCGLTRAEDAARAMEAGADALGVVFAESPRQVDLEQAKAVLGSTPGYIRRVGVFADQPIELIREAVAALRLDWVQLSGSEPAELARSVESNVVKAIHVTDEGELQNNKDYPAHAFLLDSPPLDGQMGGTGRTFDWSKAGVLPWPLDRVIVAGGLTPDNVGLAIRQLRPGGVDVSSGVESEPGVKDASMIEAFVAAVREADRRIRLTR
jgi:phosphoribosylanthranilate isomerase